MRVSSVPAMSSVTYGHCAAPYAALLDGMPIHGVAPATLGRVRAALECGDLALYVHACHGPRRDRRGEIAPGRTAHPAEALRLAATPDASRGLRVRNGPAGSTVMEIPDAAVIPILPRILAPDLVAEADPAARFRDAERAETLARRPEAARALTDRGIDGFPAALAHGALVTSAPRIVATPAAPLDR